MAYYRVIPRDFFNESKLLKCLGQFQLCVHDRTANGLPFEIEFNHEAFDIRQNPEDGSLYCANYKVYLQGHEVRLYTAYNSKDNYPLYAEYRAEEYIIFNEQGKFMPNFGFYRGE